MFSYNKLLEFPINIKNPNPRLANIIITQYGGAYIKSLTLFGGDRSEKQFRRFRNDFLNNDNFGFGSAGNQCNIIGKR